MKETSRNLAGRRRSLGIKRDELSALVGAVKLGDCGISCGSCDLLGRGEQAYWDLRRCRSGRREICGGRWALAVG